MKGYSLTIFICLFLSACGGGGDDTQPNTSQNNDLAIRISTNVEGSGAIIPVSADLQRGDSASFRITLSEGHRVKSVTGCSGQLKDTEFKVSNVNADCQIDVKFAINEYELTSINNDGASVIPAMAITEHGEKRVFEITTNPNYVLKGVEGCAGSLEGHTFTTDPISAACSITPIVEKIQHSISVNVSGDGELTPSGEIKAAQGEPLTLKIEAELGSRLKYIDGCSGYWDQTENTYAIPPVTQSCTIDAQFVVSHKVSELPISQTLKNCVPEKYTYADEVLEIQCDYKELSSLAGQIEHFYNLERLSITGNNLIELDVSKNTKLTKLNIDNNHISSLQLSNNTELANLNISYNPISEIDLKELVNL